LIRFGGDYDQNSGNFFADAFMMDRTSNAMDFSLYKYSLGGVSSLTRPPGGIGVLLLVLSSFCCRFLFFTEFKSNCSEAAVTSDA